MIDFLSLHLTDMKQDKPTSIAGYQLVRALPEPLDTYLPSIEEIEVELVR